MSENLRELINKNEIEKAIETIENIVRSKHVDLIPFLMEQIVTTDNRLLRNTIAIALSDLREQDAVPILINLLRDDKTAGSRGTILYALEELDCTSHIDFLLSLLTSSVFEESRHAFLVIEEQLVRLGEEDIKSFLIKIDNELLKQEKNRDLIEEIKELMQERLFEGSSGSQ